MRFANEAQQFATTHLFPDAARVQQSHAVDAYQEAVKVVLERFRLGNASSYEVLQEQQLFFLAETPWSRHS